MAISRLRASRVMALVFAATVAMAGALPSASGSAVDGWDFVYGSPGPADYSRYEAVKLDPAGGAYFVGFFSGTFEGLSSPTSYRRFLQHRSTDGRVSWTQPLEDMGTSLPTIDRLGPFLAVDPNGVAYVSSCSLGTCFRRTFDRLGAQLAAMEFPSLSIDANGFGFDSGVVASSDGFIVVALARPAATDRAVVVVRMTTVLGVAWQTELPEVNLEVDPKVIGDGDGGVWVAADIPRPLPTQRDALALVRVGADGARLRSAKHFGLTISAGPLDPGGNPRPDGENRRSLLTANRDFFWVSVFDDQSQTGLREPQAFRTTDGALIGPVRCAQVIPLGRPPACDLLQPSSALEHIYRPSVVGGGRRVVLTTPQSVDLYDVSGVTDLTATLVKRVPLSSSATSTVVDADDVGNIVLAGSTPSDVVFVPAAAALGTVGTALVQERAFAARNPGGRVGLEVTPYVPFELQVTGVNGVPDRGVAAVSLNVTVTEPDASGFLTVYPCGERKVVSSLNYVAGQTVPNAVIAPVSPRGTVCFYAQRSTHLLADVNGWFAAGSGYTALDPVRVFDTRPGEVATIEVVREKVGPSRILEVPVTGIAGIPAGVAAVSLNVTVTEPDASGFLTVYPCGTLREVSSLNFVAGQTVPNAVIAPVSPRGTVCFYAQRSTHLLADVNGWFAAGSGYTPLDPVRVFDTR